MKTKTKEIFSIILLLFLAFWAILGGYALIVDPTGASLQIPQTYLDNTPFDDYRMPGIILLLANGISSVVIAFSVIRRIKNYPFFIMVQGTVLLLWLTIQLVINTDFYAPHLHISCYVIGILLLAFGVMLKDGKIIHDNHVRS